MSHETELEDLEEDGFDSTPRDRLFLLASVFILGACGLIYELIAGAAASYLMGDTVTQYSLVIGTFLAAMGVGAQLTRWVRRNLLSAFLKVQLTIAVLGGFSALIMFIAFPVVDTLTPVVLGLAGVVGTLIGMEIPLIIRLLRHGTILRINLADVLSFDYIGALIASAAFPFVVLPLLGLVRAGMACGLVNAMVAALGTLMFRRHLPNFGQLCVWNGVTFAMLIAGLFMADSTTTWLEDRLYQDEIIHAETTPYQRIVITRWREDVRLHLSGHLQFSTADEYRYHEPLVYPAVSSALAAVPDDGEDLRVLVLGGGDGLALQDVFRFPRIGHVDLVDLDQRVVELFRDNPTLAALNGNSLSDPRVESHYADAMAYLRKAEGDPYHVIIMDLPDPGTVSTNKLYAKTFFGLAFRQLHPNGVLVTQASSPFYATKAFWCIYHTMHSAVEDLSAVHAGLDRRLVPYHVHIPSFGDWGFILAVPATPVQPNVDHLPEGQFLTREVFRQAQVFSPDMSEVETKINTLEHPVLMEYYLEGWKKWNE